MFRTCACLLALAFVVGAIGCAEKETVVIERTYVEPAPPPTHTHTWSTETTYEEKPVNSGSTTTYETESSTIGTSPGGMIVE